MTLPARRCAPSAATPPNTNGVHPPAARRPQAWASRPRRPPRLLLLLGLATAWAGTAGLAWAQASAPGPAPTPWSAADHSAWADMAAADAAHGRRLHSEHRCAECHARRVGGNGSAIYRPAGRIQRPAALLAMVEMCNTELKLQLFPDDVAALATALNQDHYRIRPPAR